MTCLFVATLQLTTRRPLTLLCNADSRPSDAMSFLKKREESRFVGGEKIWSESVKVIGENRKKAAVAYVGTDSFLRFGKGDTLVVDASEESIVAGRTSASVLKRAMNRGAQVYSVSRLHAKVILCGR